jgi:hypothetical protein
VFKRPGRLAQGEAHEVLVAGEEMSVHTRRETLPFAALEGALLR